MKTNRALAIIFALVLVLAPNLASATITPPSTVIEKNDQWRRWLLADGPVTASFNGNPALTAGVAACTLQYTSVVSTTNAMTVVLQGSNNGTTFVPFATNVVSNATTAQDDFYAYNNPPVRYVRVAVTLANANVITPTFDLVCR